MVELDDNSIYIIKAQFITIENDALTAIQLKQMYYCGTSGWSENRYNALVFKNYADAERANDIFQDAATRAAYKAGLPNPNMFEVRQTKECKCRIYRAVGIRKLYYNPTLNDVWTEREHAYIFDTRLAAVNERNLLIDRADSSSTENVYNWIDNTHVNPL